MSAAIANSRAQVLVVLGIMGLCPRIRADTMMHSAAGRTFERVVDMAVKAGLPRKERRLFIGGIRGGKPSPTVMARAERCIELIGPEVFDKAMAQHAAWEHFRETGRLPQGWTWRETVPQ